MLNDQNRFFRVPEHFIEIQRAYDLHVGFGQTTVNHHAAEAFVLDSRGRITTAYSRVNWEPSDALSALEQLLDAERVTPNQLHDATDQSPRSDHP